MSDSLNPYITPPRFIDKIDPASAAERAEKLRAMLAVITVMEMIEECGSRDLLRSLLTRKLMFAEGQVWEAKKAQTAQSPAAHGGE